MLKDSYLKAKVAKQINFILKKVKIFQKIISNSNKINTKK